MPTKAIRLKIINAYMDAECTAPMEEWRKDLLRLSKVCGKAGNMCLTKLYIGSIQKREIYEATGELIKGIPGCENLYQDIRQRFPELPGSVANQLERHAKDQWKRDGQKVMQLQSTLPTYKITTAPIRFHNDIYKLLTNGKKYIIDAQFYSIESKQNERRRYFTVAVRDGSSREIYKRIMNGVYKQGQLQIKKDHKGNWFCIIPYEFTQQETTLDPEKVMGVDLGIVNAVCWAFNNSHKRGYIKGGEIEQFRRTVQARRKSMQKQIKHSGDARKGHGRNRALKPIDALKEKEQDFRNTINHRYARRIVDEAAKHGCGTIQIENLEGIAEDRKFLKTWPYYDLQQKIINKAEEYGIKVEKVNPQYTSQRCSNCGHIESANRPTQAVFSCKKCGYGDRLICTRCYHIQSSGEICEKCESKMRKEAVNADYNAARNLSIPNIDYMIMAQCFSEGLDYRSYTCKDCGHKQVSGKICEECGCTKLSKPKKSPRPKNSKKVDAKV